MFVFVFVMTVKNTDNQECQSTVDEHEQGEHNLTNLSEKMNLIIFAIFLLENCF